MFFPLFFSLFSLFSLFSFFPFSPILTASFPLSGRHTTTTPFSSPLPPSRSYFSFPSNTPPPQIFNSSSPPPFSFLLVSTGRNAPLVSYFLFSFLLPFSSFRLTTPRSGRGGCRPRPPPRALPTPPSPALSVCSGSSAAASCRRQRPARRRGPAAR